MAVIGARPKRPSSPGGHMATAFAAVEIDLDRFIDLDRYPVHDLTSTIRRDLVAETRDQMMGKGCFRIPQFLRPAAVETMRLEAEALHDQVSWSQRRPQSLFLGRRRIASRRPSEAHVPTSREWLHQR